MDPDVPDGAPARPLVRSLPDEVSPHPLVVSFRSAQALMPHPTLLHDVDGGLIAVNDVAAQVIGPLDGPGRARIVVGGRELVPGDPEAPWVRSAATGDAVEQDVRIVDPAGREHWGTSYSTPTPHPAGDLVVSTIVITTERQQWAQVMLEDIRTRFEASWAESAMPVFLLGVDDDDRGRMLFANDAMHRLAGAEPGGLVGSTVGSLLDPSSPHVDDVDDVVADVIAGAEGEQTLAVALRRGDGAPPNPALLGFTVPRGPQGRPVFVIGCAIDHEPLVAAERMRHEELLRAEDLYRESADLVVFVDADGRFEFVGPSVASVLGYDRDALTGSLVFDLMHPDEVDGISGQLASTLDAGSRSESIRLRLRSATGRWKPLEMVAVAHRDRNGSDGLVLSMRDRSREEEAERAAAELDERARYIVERAADGIWVLDTENRTTYVNTAMAEMVGYEVDEMVGHDLARYIPDTQVARAEELGVRRRAGIHESFNFPLLHRDGHLVRTSVTTSPMLDAAGRYAGSVAWISDQTERIRAAERLAESESHLRGLLGAFPDNVFIMDAAGTYRELHAGSADLLGFRVPALGRTVDEVLPPDDVPGAAEAHRSAIAEALATGRTTSIEYGLVVDDEQHWFEARFSPISRHEVVALIRDVSETRRAEEARVEFLRELGRRRAAEERLELQMELERFGRLEAMGQLAGEVAHDVNNLLGVIANYASAIERSATDDCLRSDTAEIKRAVERGAELTRRLLRVGRSDDSMSKVPTDVTALVEQLVATMASTFPPGVELAAEVGSDDLVIPAVSCRLEQAVLNLVTNARDAVGDTGRVLVSVRRRGVDMAKGALLGLPVGDAVVLSVSDDGSGMDPDVRSQVFQPFFTTKEREGTGLGLSIVKKVVEEHGGAIDVTSSTDGTTVDLWFPESEARSGAVPAIEAGPVAEPIRPVVLLVDDDEDVRRSTSRLLWDLGVNVVEAVDGEDAMRTVAAATAVDLVVTDVRMPRMSGPDLARCIRELRPGLPVVFVTGYADDLMASDVDGSAVLSKPYDARRLAETLESTLGSVLTAGW